MQEITSQLSNISYSLCSICLNSGTIRLLTTCRHFRSLHVVLIVQLLRWIPPFSHERKWVIQYCKVSLLVIPVLSRCTYDLFNNISSQSGMYNFQPVEVQKHTAHSFVIFKVRMKRLGYCVSTVALETEISKIKYLVQFLCCMLPSNCFYFSLCLVFPSLWICFFLFVCVFSPFFPFLGLVTVN